MELITKNYFYTVVSKYNKDWYFYRISLSDFKISKDIYSLNYLLIDDIIPAAYISSIEQLIIPKEYGELSKDRLKNLESESLTINTWEIIDLEDQATKSILTRNELTRVPYNSYVSDGLDFNKRVNELPNCSFILKSKLDTSFKEEIVQIIDNPEKYSYRKKLICNSCIKNSFLPEDFWVNYLYNILTLVINLKYLKNVDISERND